MLVLPLCGHQNQVSLRRKHAKNMHARLLRFDWLRSLENQQSCQEINKKPLASENDTETESVAACRSL